MVKLSLILCVLFLLSGCWSAEEIDSTALAHGVGLDKVEDKIKLSLEIIRPIPQEGVSKGQDVAGSHIILESEVDTPLTGVRAMIRTSKRRLHFEHTRVWVIGYKLAEQDLINHLDIIRRDQMLRLRSYLFVTKNDPAEVLRTPTLYENLTSLELSDAMDDAKYTTGYVSVNIYEFFARLEGVLPNAFLPMIRINKSNHEPTTSLEGTAVFKNGKMVGELSINETIGLNWLLNQVEGGSITIELDNQQKGAVRIKHAKTKIIPTLEGEQLQADVLLHLDGDFIDNPLDYALNETKIKQIRDKIARKVENDVRLALKKLQGELKTDITGIGLTTYRKYPRRWNEVYQEWDEIFANADINVQVDVSIIHSGKIKENLKRERRKPANNPFLFKQSDKK